MISHILISSNLLLLICMFRYCFKKPWATYWLLGGEPGSGGPNSPFPTWVDVDFVILASILSLQCTCMGRRRDCTSPWKIIFLRTVNMQRPRLAYLNSQQLQPRRLSGRSSCTHEQQMAGQHCRWVHDKFSLFWYLLPKIGKINIV